MIYEYWTRFFVVVVVHFFFTVEFAYLCFHLKKKKPDGNQRTTENSTQKIVTKNWMLNGFVMILMCVWMNEFEFAVENSLLSGVFFCCLNSIFASSFRMLYFYCLQLFIFSSTLFLLLLTWIHQSGTQWRRMALLFLFRFIWRALSIRFASFFCYSV